MSRRHTAGNNPGLRWVEVVPRVSVFMESCPTCGSEHETTAGMKRHHALKHGESIAGEEVDCAICGTKMRVRPYRKERYADVVCSRKCRRDLKSENASGEHNKVEFSCGCCGTDVFRWPSQVKGEVYCSRSCAGKASAKSGTSSPRYNSTWFQCPVCGKGVTRPKAHVDRVKTAYCSRDCANIGHAGLITGDANPNYIDGSSGTATYGPNWPDQRERAVLRDQGKCVECGTTREEHYEQWGCDLNVHHKERICSFDDPDDGNRLDNLITLCQRCHGIHEHGDANQLEVD